MCHSTMCTLPKHLILHIGKYRFDNKCKINNPNFFLVFVIYKIKC